MNRVFKASILPHLSVRMTVLMINKYRRCHERVETMSTRFHACNRWTPGLTRTMPTENEGKLLGSNLRLLPCDVATSAAMHYYAQNFVELEGYTMLPLWRDH